MPEDEEEEGGKKKSRLYKLKPILDRLPAVKKPEIHVRFGTKMWWTFGLLVIYFILTNVMIYGLDQQKAVDVFAGFRAIMAGASGSLMHLGIGPIVTGSIIMQLFTGAKIIGLDLTKKEDKAIYQGTQKLLVIIMIFVESVPQTYGLLVPSVSFDAQLNNLSPGNGENLARFAIVMQLFVGSYLVFLMDEVVSKWGIGSGVSLFIAAGVAESIFIGSVNWAPVSDSLPMSLTNPPSGTIPKTIYLATTMSSSDLTRGGYEIIFIQNPNPMIAFIGTIFIFLIVAYAESSSIELPLAHGKVRGARGRYPIRLIYASNIPVILMAALLANINMFALLFWQHPTLSQTPILGHNPYIGAYTDPLNPTVPTMGGAYYTYQIAGLSEWLLPLMNPVQYSAYMRGHSHFQVFIHLIVYLAMMIGGSILFAKFWIDTTNMGPEAVAKQIERSGMQIPGFRRDPRVLKRVLERYIPMVTVLSGAMVGALAAFADMIGTVGNASGTGVLLMTGIIIRMYEQIGKEKAMEMHPMLRQFFGKD
ncbi:MAG: preprotein translocase subunit SecY [Euryarchaeota archaeon]|nr:preprotein translocase subunit SecY [Euryarchaeota archaeon]